MEEKRGESWLWTYGTAANLIVNRAIVVVEDTLAIVPAVVAEIVTNNLDLEVKVRIGGGSVLEHGQECFFAVIADTEVHRGEVTHVLALGTPLATLLGGDTLVVDVVLSGSVLVVPLEVVLAVGASERLGLTSRCPERDSLGLRTGVVSTTDGDLRTHVIADIDTTIALHAKLLLILVSAVELTTLALETTNGLEGRALGGGPLRLLVTGLAGIGAHSTIFTGVTGDGGHDVTNNLAHDGHILDTRPTTQLEVGEGNGTVFRREGVTIDLSVGEFTVNALSAEAGRAAGAGGAGAGGAGGASGNSSGCRSARGGRFHGAAAGRRAAGANDSGSLLQNLRGGGRGRSRGWGGSRGASAGTGRASGRDSRVEPLQLVVRQTSTSVLVADGLGGTGVLRVHHNKVVHGRTGNSDSVHLGLSGASVEASMAVAAVGSRQGAGRSQSQGNGVGELHCGRLVRIWDSDVQTGETCQSLRSFLIFLPSARPCSIRSRRACFADRIMESKSIISSVIDSVIESTSSGITHTSTAKQSRAFVKRLYTKK